MRGETSRREREKERERECVLKTRNETDSETMNINHVNIQKPKKLFEQIDSLLCAPVVVTGVVMGKGIKIFIS